MPWSFTDDVRAGRVPHPTQRTFSSDVWTRKFADSGDTSGEAERLHEAGLWAHTQLGSIRSRLEATGLAKISRDEILRLCVGAVNTALHDVWYRALQHPSESEPIPIDRFGSIGDIAETLVDGARYPIAMAISRAPQRGDKVSDENFRSVTSALHLGVAYDHIERLWDYCLWLGWTVAPAESATVISPIDKQAEIRREVGRFRFGALVTELALQTDRYLRQVPLNRAGPGQKRVTDIQGRGKYKQLRLAAPALESLDVDEVDTVSSAASVLYFPAVLDEPLPRLRNLTARQILAAWNALAPLGALLRDRAQRATTRGAIMNNAVGFRRIELIRAIQDCVDLTGEQARCIWELLELKGTPREELWFKPFVPVASDQVLPLAVALGSSSPLRRLEHWLKIGGLDLSTRGPLFEQRVREYLQQNNKLSNAYVHDAGVVARADVGDIDLWLQVGDSILIGECKCSLFPASGAEILQYERVLTEAALQVRRKADAVLAEPKRWLAAAGRPSQSQLNKVIPIVVSNLPLGSGMIVNGISVIDIHILAKFLADSHVEHHVVLHRNEPIQIGRRVRLYDDPRDAETKLEGYLLDPPQISLVRDAVRETTRPLYASVTGQVVAMTTFEVVMSS